MTMKRILHCTLIFMVLVASGCDLLGSDTDTSQNTDPENPRPIKWAAISEQVTHLINRINSEANQELKAGEITDGVQKILTPLGKTESDLPTKCNGCRPDVLLAAQQARKSLDEVLKKVPDKPDTPISAEMKITIGPLLQMARGHLNEADRLSRPPTPQPFWHHLILPGKILAGVLALVLFAMVLSYLWKRAWKTVEFNLGQVVAGHLAATREAQPDYASKLSSLSSTQTEMSSRLTELDTEVRSLARFVRESLATRRSDRNPSYGGFNYQSHVEEVAPKEEPEFPVSAVDYLGKMNRFANVVRPDFQNGILVNDPDGNGELVLIRDSRDETQPLFVVPRATQFHTKQDFYTYYQKYYDCVRPSAGDVWIIGPAVVEKVSGGWQLREKGMLEVR